MRSRIFNRLYVVLAVAIAGCAGASVTQQSQSAPVNAAPPTQIVVYPFAVDASDVTLNQGIVQRLYRNASGENQNVQQSQIAHETAQNVCLEVVSALTQKGYSAICQKRGVPLTGNNVVLVDGEFTDISEGNRLRRMVIGLGAGASVLETSVQMYHRTDEGSNQLLEFATHADSGKMPGAGITGPAGAAAGGAAAAVSLGVNVAAAGVKTHTSATGYLGDKTAAQIVDKITQYFGQQGWAPPTSPAGGI
jgi:hypothetical protein